MSIAHSGERNYNAKLTNKSVQEIKYFLKNKLKTIEQLAIYYNINRQILLDIKNNKRWKSVII